MTKLCDKCIIIYDFNTHEFGNIYEYEELSFQKELLFFLKQVADKNICIDAKKFYYSYKYKAIHLYVKHKINTDLFNFLKIVIVKLIDEKQIQIPENMFLSIFIYPETLIPPGKVCGAMFTQPCGSVIFVIDSKRCTRLGYYGYKPIAPIHKGKKHTKKKHYIYPKYSLYQNQLRNLNIVFTFFHELSHAYYGFLSILHFLRNPEGLANYAGFYGEIAYIEYLNGEEFSPHHFAKKYGAKTIFDLFENIPKHLEKKLITEWEI